MTLPAFSIDRVHIWPVKIDALINDGWFEELLCPGQILIARSGIVQIDRDVVGSDENPGRTEIIRCLMLVVEMPEQVLRP